MDSAPLKKSYYAVIPADVRYCEKLVDGAKLLYGEITALCNERGYCWATNEYFAQLYGNDARTISRWLTALVKEDFIYIDTTKGMRKIFLQHKFNPEAVYEDHMNTAEAPIVATAPKAKKPKKEKKEIVPKFTETDMRLAQLLLQKIIYNFPVFENKTVKLNDWADDIRKLRTLNEAGEPMPEDRQVTPYQIEFMITWLHGGEYTPTGKPTRTMQPHDFWSKNILSASKLRKQWFTLVPQLQEELKKQVKKSTVAQL